MTTLIEGAHTGEFILSEAEHGRSRDNITIASGSGVILPGDVLAKVTASGKFKKSTDTGSDGGQTAIAVAISGCDATSADKVIPAITRAAQVKAVALTYDASVSDATKRGTKATQLAAVGIVVR
ncbi:MAG: head decoration protein [Delftia acidovorans]|nr:MAG: head decoration protein [Delftia acidovorans]